MEYIQDTLAAVPFLLISIVAAMAAMSSLALFVKVFNNISLKEELSHRDNFAAGFSVAGALFALGCVISGASAGDFGDSLMHEITLLLVYIAVGLVTLVGSRHLFDRFSFPGFSVHDEIMKENSAVGIADMGNTIASGLIILNVMLWVDSVEYFDVIYVVGAWALSQAVLFFATVYRNQIQSRFGGKKTISELLLADNKAVAIRLAGYRIGVALAMMATTNIITFDFENVTTTAMAWFVIALGFAATSTIIGLALRKVVLRGINVWEEVEEQNNAGIATIQAALFIVGSLIIIGVTH